MSYLLLGPAEELASSPTPSSPSALLLRSSSDEDTDANSECSAIASPSYPEGLLDSLISIWDATTLELCEVLPMPYSVSCLAPALDLLSAPNRSDTSRASLRDAQPVEPRPAALVACGLMTFTLLVCNE